MSIAIVTGSNKGIGFEIARKMGAAGIKTILACRNETLGLEAQAILRDEGLNVEFRRLDISSESSIDSFSDSIRQDYDAIDILVNNAAIAFKESDPTPFTQQARPTMTTNFLGTLRLTENLLPLLRKSSHPRIVNVASEAGHLRILKNQEKRSIFESSTLTTNALVTHMQSFISDVESGTHADKGWPNTCYGMSKLAVIAWTKILARQEPTMKVNACCPGYCDTDMSSHKGPRSPEEGARTPALLALLPPNCDVTGKFYANERVMEW